MRYLWYVRYARLFPGRVGLRTMRAVAFGPDAVYANAKVGFTLRESPAVALSWCLDWALTTSALSSKPYFAVAKFHRSDAPVR